MMKLFAMLLAFGLCSFIGVRSSMRLKQRAKLLALLQSTVKRMIIRMEYERKPLAHIVIECAHGELKPFWQTFGKALSRGADTKAAFADALRAADAEIIGFNAIGDQERELLRAFAAALGSTDLDGQRQNAAILLAGLEPLKEAAASEYRTKSRVYRTMGMLCGAAVVVLML